MIIVPCLADICPNRRYTLRAPANQLCYLHYQIAEDFSASNRSCVRDGANLLSIDDSEEDSYVNQTFFLSQNGMEFWIGLNDLDNEGNFRLVLHRPASIALTYSPGSLEANYKSFKRQTVCSLLWS